MVDSVGDGKMTSTTWIGLSVAERVRAAHNYKKVQRYLVKSPIALTLSNEDGPRHASQLARRLQ